MNQLTSKFKEDQFEEKCNTSIEKENEDFLKESDDESISSTSSEDFNNEKLIETKSLMNLSTSSSSSADSSTNDNKSEYENASESQNSNSQDVDHHCTYFNSELSAAIDSCIHKLNENINKKSISQNICINCEYGKELKDSLEHMAFLSPDDTEKKSNKFELQFDSPTLEKFAPKEFENLNQNTEASSENEELESPTIINDTITDETELVLDETQNNRDTNFKFNQSQMNYSFKQFKQKSKSTNSSKRSSLSETGVSETTLMLSDSDSNDEKSFMIDYLEYKTRKHELKRKRALEDYEISDKSLIMLESFHNSKISDQFNLINVPLHSDENWFCPNFNPPTIDDLDNKFKTNNEPIVKYYKKRGKFKMVIFYSNLKF
jgi:hypothetical protein